MVSPVIYTLNNHYKSLQIIGVYDVNFDHTGKLGAMVYAVREMEAAYIQPITMGFVAPVNQPSSTSIIYY